MRRRKVPAELTAALHAQCRQRRLLLEQGAQRVGWKLGMGQRERIAGEHVLGYLTSATQLESGARYDARGATELHADAEVAIQLREAVAADASEAEISSAVGAYAPALELVDLAGPDDPAAIVAANVWHRAFALGPASPSFPAGGASAQLVIDGDERGSGRSAAGFAEHVTTVARLLSAVGERLEPGDWIITGSVVQIRVAAGNEVAADFDGLGRACLTIV